MDENLSQKREILRDISNDCEAPNSPNCLGSPRLSSVICQTQRIRPIHCPSLNHTHPPPLFVFNRNTPITHPFHPQISPSLHTWASTVAHLQENLRSEFFNNMNVSQKRHISANTPSRSQSQSYTPSHLTPPSETNSENINKKPKLDFSPSIMNIIPPPHTPPSTNHSPNILQLHSGQESQCKELYDQLEQHANQRHNEVMNKLQEVVDMADYLEQRIRLRGTVYRKPGGFPIRTVEEFEEFEQADRQRHLELVQYLQCVGGRNFKDAINDFLRESMTDELVMSFTFWGRQSKRLGTRHALYGSKLADIFFEAARNCNNLMTIQMSDLQYYMRKAIHLAKRRHRATKLREMQMNDRERLNSEVSRILPTQFYKE